MRCDLSRTTKTFWIAAALLILGRITLGLLASGADPKLASFGQRLSIVAKT